LLDFFQIFLLFACYGTLRILLYKRYKFNVLCIFFVDNFYFSFDSTCMKISGLCKHSFLTSKILQFYWLKCKINLCLFEQFSIYFHIRAEHNYFTVAVNGTPARVISLGFFPLNWWALPSSTVINNRQQPSPGLIEATCNNPCGHGYRDVDGSPTTPFQTRSCQLAGWRLQHISAGWLT
jgi:hypothetical protein